MTLGQCPFAGKARGKGVNRKKNLRFAGGAKAGRKRSGHFPKNRAAKGAELRGVQKMQRCCRGCLPKCHRKYLRRKAYEEKQSGTQPGLCAGRKGDVLFATGTFGTGQKRACGLFLPANGRAKPLAAGFAA